MFLAKTADLDDAPSTTIWRAGSPSTASCCWSCRCSSARTCSSSSACRCRSVQVAGGAVVCAMGWNLLNEPDDRRRRHRIASRAPTVRRTWRARAFYPLTMPLTVGPGSISVAITLGAQPRRRRARADHDVDRARARRILIVVMTVFLCYRYAERLLRALGDVGTSSCSRLIGVHPAVHRRADPLERRSRGLVGDASLHRGALARCWPAGPTLL